jgi:hypothetical protein
MTRNQPIIEKMKSRSSNPKMGLSRDQKSPISEEMAVATTTQPRIL